MKLSSPAQNVSNYAFIIQIIMLIQNLPLFILNLLF